MLDEYSGDFNRHQTNRTGNEQEIANWCQGLRKEAICGSFNLHSCVVFFSSLV